MIKTAPHASLVPMAARVDKNEQEFTYSTNGRFSISRPEHSRMSHFHTPTSPNLPLSMQPVWDRERRELRLGDIVVKRFKWPAENQERVLDAFQEEGWPPRIDDPIMAHRTICPKRRLHDTLKCLNRKQKNPLIKFRGDGTGTAVLLEIVVG